MKPLNPYGTEWHEAMEGCEFGKIGEITDSGKLQILHREEKLIELDNAEMKKTWKETLKW